VRCAQGRRFARTSPFGLRRRAPRYDAKLMRCAQGRNDDASLGRRALRYDAKLGGCASPIIRSLCSRLQICFNLADASSQRRSGLSLRPCYAQKSAAQYSNSRNAPNSVIPAKAGIHFFATETGVQVFFSAHPVGSRFRGNDKP
jgi:hypothetical protein